MLCMLLIIKQLHRLRKEFNDKNIKVCNLSVFSDLTSASAVSR